MIGGILYSWVKYHEGEKKKRDKSGEMSANDSNPETPDSQVRKLSQGYFECIYVQSNLS
jgi:hypothetical protein